MFQQPDVSAEWRSEFSSAFCANAPKGFDAKADAGGYAPWQEPWIWADAADWFLKDSAPEFLGERWAEKVCQMFADGFADAAPDGYDPAVDTETSNPWCCPWFWDNENWYRPNLTPHELGKVYAKQCYSKLAEVLAEQRELEKAEAAA